MKSDSMIARFSLSFINNYRAAILLVLSLILLGSSAYTSLLKREGFPEVDVPYVQINALYPVNDTELVNNDVTKPLEELILELDEVKELNSFTSRVSSTLVVEMQNGYTSADGEELIKDQVSGSDFSVEAEITYSTFDASKIFGIYDMAFAVSDKNGGNLNGLADEIATEIQSLPEVLKAEKIDNYENQVNPITGEETEVQKSFTRIGTKENGEINFKDSSFIGVVKANDSLDAIDLSDAINNKIAMMQEDDSKYDNVEFVFGAGDVSVYLRDQITSLEQNALGGLLAVVVILFFFVNWRASLVTALFIPTVMLTVFLGLYGLGYSLNVISLFSLILVLGLFVDDAIVVVEAIDVEKQKGKKGREAVLAAIKNVGSADIMGSITTLLVFAPMLFITGILGEFIILIPITVILSLVVSIIIGLSIVPLLSNVLIRKNTRGIVDSLLGSGFLFLVLWIYLSLTNTENGGTIFVALFGLYILYFLATLVFTLLNLKKGKASTKEVVTDALDTTVYGPGRFVNYISEKIGATIGYSLKTRKRAMIVTPLMILFSLILIVAGFMVAGGLKFSIFAPPKDSENIAYTYSVNVQNVAEQGQYALLTQDEKINISKEVAREVEDKLQDYTENIQNVTYLMADESGATVDVLLTTMDSRDVTAAEISEKLNEDFLGYDKAQVKFNISSAGPPVDEFPFAMQIFDEDRNVLENSVSEISDYLRTVEFEDGEKVVEVREEQFLSINKKDGQRFAEIRVKFTDNENTALITQLQEKVEAEFVSERLNTLGLDSDSLGFDFGQESENLESFESTLLALNIALLLMYGLLVLQYRSFLQPVIIFLAIPLSFPGLFPGLAITDNPISFFVSLGIIGLAGIVVNNSIMLVDYANQLKAEGIGTREAIAEAAKLRFRPIITTSATTIAGLAPLAFSDPFWEGLAFSIIFGLISSSLLIIFILPYYYILVEGIRDLKRKAIVKLKLV